MFGNYAQYIIPGYGATAVIFAALVVWLWWQNRSLRNILDKLEQSGMARRSSRAKKAASDE